MNMTSRDVYCPLLTKEARQKGDASEVRETVSTADAYECKVEKRSTECNPPHKRVDGGFGSMISFLMTMSTVAATDSEVPIHWPVTNDGDKPYLYSRYCPVKMDKNRRFRESTGPKLVPLKKKAVKEKIKKIKKQNQPDGEKERRDKAKERDVRKIRASFAAKSKTEYTPTVPTYGWECQAALNRVRAREQHNLKLISKPNPFVSATISADGKDWAIVPGRPKVFDFGFPSFDWSTHVKKASVDPLVIKLTTNYLHRLYTEVESGKYYDCQLLKRIANSWIQSFKKRKEAELPQQKKRKAEVIEDDESWYIPQDPVDSYVGRMKKVIGYNDVYDMPKISWRSAKRMAESIGKFHASIDKYAKDETALAIKTDKDGVVKAMYPIPKRFVSKTPKFDEVMKRVLSEEQEDPELDKLVQDSIAHFKVDKPIDSSTEAEFCMGHVEESLSCKSAESLRQQVECEYPGIECGHTEILQDLSDSCEFVEPTSYGGLLRGLRDRMAPTITSWQLSGHLGKTKEQQATSILETIAMLIIQLRSAIVKNESTVGMIVDIIVALLVARKSLSNECLTMQVFDAFMNPDTEGYDEFGSVPSRDPNPGSSTEEQETRDHPLSEGIPGALSSIMESVSNVIDEPGEVIGQVWESLEDIWKIKKPTESTNSGNFSGKTVRQVVEEIMEGNGHTSELPDEFRSYQVKFYSNMCMASESTKTKIASVIDLLNSDCTLVESCSAERFPRGKSHATRVLSALGEIVYVIAAFVMTPFCGWDLSSAAHKASKVQFGRQVTHSIDLSEMFFQAMKFIQPRVYDLVHNADIWHPTTWSWTNFFHGEKKYIETVEHLSIAEKLVSKVGVKDIGSPNWVSDEMLFSQKIDELGANIDYIVIRAKSESNKDALKEANSLKLRHLCLQTTFRQNSLSGKMRKAPICFQLVGNSSIGKSSVMSLMHICMCRVYGLDPNTSEMFQSSPGDKYNSGFKNSHTTWSHDDVSAVKLQYQPQGAIDVIDILRKVNNQPFGVVQADVSDKGTKFFTGKLVLLSTNVEDMNLGQVMSCPEATFRRVIKVQVSLSEEFRSQEGGLDKDKFTHYRQMNGEGTCPDAWSFQVSKYCLNRNTYIQMPEMTTREFFKWYAQELITHDAQQDNVMSSDSSWRQTSFCADCGSFGTCICAEGQAVAVSWRFFGIPSKIDKMSSCAEEVAEDVKASSQAIQDMGKRMDRFMSITLKIGIGFSLMMATYVTCQAIKKVSQLMAKDESRPSAEYVLSRRPEGESMNTWQQRFDQPSRPRIPEIVKTTGSQDFERIVEACSSRVGCITQFGKTAHGNVGSCTLLSRNLFLTAKHVLADMDLDRSINIDMSPDKEGMTLSLIGVYARAYHFEAKDLSILMVPGGIASRDLSLTNKTNDLFKKRFLEDPDTLKGWQVLGISRNIHGELKYSPGYVHEGIRSVKMEHNGAVKDFSMIPALVKEKIEKGQSGGLVLCHDNNSRVGCLGVLSARGKKPETGDPIMYVTSVSSNDIDKADSYFKTEYYAETVSAMVAPKVVTPVLDINSSSHLSKLNICASGIPICYMANTGTHSKSNNEKPIIPPYLRDTEEFFGCKYKFGLPYFGKEPWVVNIASEVEKRGFVPPDLVKITSEEVSKRFLQRMADADPNGFFLGEMEIVSDHVAINGVKEIDYMNGSKMSSSAGYPFSGRKEKLFDGMRPNAKMAPELQQVVDDTILAYNSGEVYGHITKGNLKLEVLPEEKVKKKGTRVFSVVPYACVHLQKRLWMTLKRMFFSHRFAFESAIGFNSDCADVGDVVDYIMQKGNKYGRVPRFIAGDYQKFDKRLDPVVLMYVFKVIDTLCLSQGSGILSKFMPDGTPQREIYEKWSKGLMTETLFGYGTYDGNLFQRQFGMTSGFFLTSEFGCIFQSIIGRLIFSVCHYHMKKFGKTYDDDKFWVEEYPKLISTISWSDIVSDKEFSGSLPDSFDAYEEYIRALHYGDDHIISTLISYPNGKIYEILCPNLFNMGYTDAQKTTDIKPFNNFSELDFLKRNFRYDNELEDWVAPLLEKSRAKSLNIRVRGEATEIEGHYSSLMSSSNEAWKLGREYYDKHCELINSIVAKYFMPGFYTPKSYDEQVLAWKERNDTTSAQPLFVAGKCYTSGRCGVKVASPSEIMQDVCVEACAGEADDIKEVAEEVADVLSVAGVAPETDIHYPGLDRWFERPVVLLDKDFPVADKHTEIFPIWETFFKSNKHRDKISNYSMLRANLHIQIEVTGSPFVAGRVFVAFLPFESHHSKGHTFAQPKHDFSRLSEDYFMTLSKIYQMDHLELDVSQSQSGHLEIPLIYDSDLVSISDLKDLGSLVVISTKPMFASADQIAYHVNCFAWATDVQLAGKIDTTVTRVEATSLTSKTSNETITNINSLCQTECLDGIIQLESVRKTSGLLDVAPSPPYQNEGSDYIRHSYMSLFASVSEYWKGDIIYRFRIIKTNYHKGKLVFWFSTNRSSDYTLCDHIIIDIDKHYEFDIRILYSEKRWLSTGEQCGYLHFQQYAPLVGPVPNVTLEMHMTKRASDDFRFAKLKPIDVSKVGTAVFPVIGKKASLDANKSKKLTAGSKAVVGAPRKKVVEFILGTKIKSDDIGMQQVLTDISDFISPYQLEYKSSFEVTGDILITEHGNMPALKSGHYSQLPNLKEGVKSYLQKACENYMPTYLGLFATCYYGYRGAIKRMIEFMPSNSPGGSSIIVSNSRIGIDRDHITATDLSQAWAHTQLTTSEVLVRGSALAAVEFESKDYHVTHFHNTTIRIQETNAYKVTSQFYGSRVGFTHLVSKGSGFSFCLSRYAPILVRDKPLDSSSGRGERT